MGYSSYTNRKRAFRLQRLQLGKVRRARRKDKLTLPDFRETISNTNAGIARITGTKPGLFHAKQPGLPKL